MMLFFAALQWNDVDAPIWVTIYLITAILALGMYKEICLPCSAAWATMIILLSIYMLVGTIPGLNNLSINNAYDEIFLAMSDEKLYIEQTREFLGLSIIVTYCFGVLISLFYKQMIKTK